MTAELSGALGAALLLGLAGAGHCLGMCGGIAVALRSAQGSHRLMPVSYHLGRIISYALLGGLLGSAAGAIQLAPWTVALRFLAGFLLVAMGLHTLGLWFGIRHLEQAGSRIWRYIAPTAQSLMPPKRLTQGFMLGGLWGFMPCGLIYSALTWSAAEGASAIDSSLLMLAFGVGTLPAMLGATLLGQRVTGFLQKPWVRKGLGMGLVLAGVWSLWLTSSHLGHLLGTHSTNSMHHQATHGGTDPLFLLTPADTRARRNWRRLSTMINTKPNQTSTKALSVSVEMVSPRKN